MHKYKKAQLQIQFNWIFVLIIGSVFLLFFFGIINTQSKTTDEKISISQSKYFETVITATGQKPGTLKEYALNNLEVAFSCDAQTNEYGYSVQGLPSRDTKYDVIFTQNILRGDDIQTWTQIWNVPFKAAIFMYITNSHQGFIFYDYGSIKEFPVPTTYFKQLYDKFPKNISVEVIDITFNYEDVIQRNYESNTYVFLFGEEPLDITFDENIKNRIVIIVPDDYAETLFDYGTVFFFNQTDYGTLVKNLEKINVNSDDAINQRQKIYDEFSKHSSPYLGKASLYGAIFSETKQIYECNMGKAFKRLKLAILLQSLRIDEFENNELLSNSCRGELGFNGDNVGDASFFVQNKLNYMNTILHEFEFSETNVNEIFTELQELDDSNKNILAIANCPPLY